MNIGNDRVEHSSASQKPLHTVYIIHFGAAYVHPDVPTWGGEKIPHLLADLHLPGAGSFPFLCLAAQFLMWGQPSLMQRKRRGFQKGGSGAKVSSGDRSEPVSRSNRMSSLFSLTFTKCPASSKHHPSLFASVLYLMDSTPTNPALAMGANYTRVMVKKARIS